MPRISVPTAGMPHPRESASPCDGLEFTFLQASGGGRSRQGGANGVTPKAGQATEGMRFQAVAFPRTRRKTGCCFGRGPVVRLVRG